MSLLGKIWKNHWSLFSRTPPITATSTNPGLWLPPTFNEARKLSLLTFRSFDPGRQAALWSRSNARWREKLRHLSSDHDSPVGATDRRLVGRFKHVLNQWWHWTCQVMNRRCQEMKKLNDFFHKVSKWFNRVQPTMTHNQHQSAQEKFGFAQRNPKK